MKFKAPFNETLLLAATALGVVTFTAIVSHYPGLVEMKVGPSGGQLTIDGRQPSDALK